MFNFTLGANLRVADLLNADARARVGLQLSDISDIVGVLSITSGITVPINTVTFGVVNDGDPGFLSNLGIGLPNNTPLHFFTEGDAGQNQFITAALNVNGGPVYSATFVSDVETSSVPDNGATISLLGIGFAAIGAIRRRVLSA